MGPGWYALGTVSAHCVQIRAIDVRSTEERRANYPFGIRFYDGFVNANRRPSNRHISTTTEHTNLSEPNTSKYRNLTLITVQGSLVAATKVHI